MCLNPTGLTFFRSSSLSMLSILLFLLSLLKRKKYVTAIRHYAVFLTLMPQKSNSLKLIFKRNITCKKLQLP